MISKINKAEKYKRIAFWISFGIVNTIIIALSYNKIALTMILLGMMAIIGLMKGNSRINTAIFISAAIIGPVLELIGVSYGAWSYPIVNIWNIPSWLIILWGNTAIFFYNFGKEISE